MFSKQSGTSFLGVSYLIENDNSISKIQNLLLKQRLGAHALWLALTPSIRFTPIERQSINSFRLPFFSSTRLSESVSKRFQPRALVFGLKALSMQFEATEDLPKQFSSGSSQLGVDYSE